MLLFLPIQGSAATTNRDHLSLKNWIGKYCQTNLTCGRFFVPDEFFIASMVLPIQELEQHWLWADLLSLTNRQQTTRESWFKYQCVRVIVI
jgi:hypothetical protein